MLRKPRCALLMGCAFMCLDKALITSLFGNLDPFDFPLICLQNNLCIVNIFFTSLTSQPEPLAIRTIHDSLMSIGSELSNSATPNKQTNVFRYEAPRRRIEFVKQGKPFASQNCVKFFFFFLTCLYLSWNPSWSSSACNLPGFCFQVLLEEF